MAIARVNAVSVIDQDHVAVIVAVFELDDRAVAASVDRAAVRIIEIDALVHA